MIPSLAQTHQIVELCSPVTTNGGVTTDVISCKNAVRAYMIFHFTQAVGHATVITPRQATDVAAGTNAVIPAVPIYYNEDCAASGVLAAATAAANYTLAATIKHKIVVFEIDLAGLTDTYDCLYATVSDSSQATNFVEAKILLLSSYQGASQPNAIVD